MAFFQDPIFQYEGVEDDDVVGAMLLEQVIRIHCIKTKVPLAIHTVLRDSLCIWSRDWHPRVEENLWT
jgi:hypothetical protein